MMQWINYPENPAPIMSTSTLETSFEYITAKEKSVS